MSDARANILARLKRAPRQPLPELPAWTPATWDDRVGRFRAMLEASHAELHAVTAAGWPERLRAILADKGVETLLVPAGETRFAGGVPYDATIEELRDLLVHRAEAALTHAKGAIAETGTLVLWPTADEPRLMSLLPPIHVAVVRQSTLVDSMAEALKGWAGAMPTNALLVSGPSKTADIEQTLAYGVHGPKELVVLLVEDA